MNTKDYRLIAKFIKTWANNLVIDKERFPLFDQLVNQFIWDFADDKKFSDNIEQMFKDDCFGIESVSVHYNDIVMDVSTKHGISYFTLKKNGRLSVGINNNRSTVAYNILINLGLRNKKL